MTAKKVRVHACINTFEAHIVRTALEQHDIHAEIRNELLAPLAGALPFAGMMAEVWIEAADLPLAREVLRVLERPAEGRGELSLATPDDGTGQLGLAGSGGELSAAEGLRCPACGEESPPDFGECWQCQHELGG